MRCAASVATTRKAAASSILPFLFGCRSAHLKAADEFAQGDRLRPELLAGRRHLFTAGRIAFGYFGDAAGRFRALSGADSRFRGSRCDFADSRRGSLDARNDAAERLASGRDAGPKRSIHRRATCRGATAGQGPTTAEQGPAAAGRRRSMATCSHRAFAGRNDRNRPFRPAFWGAMGRWAIL